jgi:hypothetical protein
MTFLVPTNRHIRAFMSHPPWLKDTNVANAWQAYAKYMTFSGGSPHVSSWGAQNGSTPFAVNSGTVDLQNTAYGKYSTMGNGIFTADAVASSFSGASTPFSLAFLFAMTATQTSNHYGFSVTHSANATETSISLAFTGTNSNFQFFRRNSLNVQGAPSSVFTCANNTWYAIEAYYDGSLFTSYQNGTVVDNGISGFSPGGTITVDSMTLDAYHANSGFVLTASARYHAILCTGGSVWPDVTKRRVRDYLNRLRLVVA